MITTRQSSFRNRFFTALFLMAVLVFSGLNAQNPDQGDRPAEYQGEKDMSWAIAHYMVYPEEEKDTNRGGIVDVSWTVTKKGKVKNVKVALNRSKKFSEIAIARKKLENKDVLEVNQAVIDNLIRSVEMLNFRPARKNGKTVKSVISTSVEFILID